MFITRLATAKGMGAMSDVDTKRSRKSRKVTVCDPIRMGALTALRSVNGLAWGERRQFWIANPNTSKHAHVSEMLQCRLHCETCVSCGGPRLSSTYASSSPIVREFASAIAWAFAVATTAAEGTQVSCTQPFTRPLYCSDALIFNSV